MKKKFNPLTMKEINEKKNTNGYNVVSTFSGAGGSCLGLKLAGFNINYAVEFIPEAQRTYALNHPDTYLDKRDIRQIKGKEILDKINLKKGELDLFEGSPPCSGFSSAGKGSKGWNCVKPYSDTKQRVDDLFFEFIRVIDETRPKMILAENVPSLATGKNKGMLKLIINSFKDIGYSVRMKVLDASLLDVPQRRNRLIFIGKREDLNIDIKFPTPNTYRYTVGDVFDDFRNHKPHEGYEVPNKGTKTFDVLRYCQKHHMDLFANAKKKMYGNFASYSTIVVFENKPVRTIVQSTRAYHGYQFRTLSIDELKRLQTFPDDFILTGNFDKQWERIGRSVPPKMYEAVGLKIKESLDEFYER